MRPERGIDMEVYSQILTENDCFKKGRVIVPRGVMVHSTGANNPELRRYVQPDDGRLGVNPNGNHWNRPGVSKCVHAFIGRTAEGEVAAYQTLPWTCRGWHCGGEGNDTHLSFEICEDGLDDGEYFARVYRAAVELTAMLCRKFGLDPLEDGVVLDHREGHRRGIASGHGDVGHWFARFGKTMDDFRADTAAQMEEDDMTQEKFNEMMDAYLARLGGMPPSDWSAEERAWAEGEGIIKGDGQGEKRYQSFCTREQMVTFLYRLYEKLK